MQLYLILCLVAGAFASRDCPDNSHYNSCGTACPITCENYLNPPKVCVLMCNPGCHCDEGYVKTKDGRCVRPEQCSSNAVCGVNQEFKSCGTACPLTCDNYDNPPRIYTLQCIIGCQCKEGYVKTRDGRCVRPENCPPRTAVCGVNQEFKSCGTACPLTCDNYEHPPRIYTLQCIIGCQCKEGYVKTRDGRCVRPESCPTRAEVNSCLMEADGGMCRGYFPMYYYDAKTGKCQEFIYGGCQGNGNRFTTEEECLRKCSSTRVHEAKSDVCDQPIERGLCLAFLHRYAYDKETGECKKFVYGGCGGNKNNFRSLEECKSACVD